MKILKKLFRYFTPYLGEIFLYIILGLIVVALGMLMPKVQELIFDNLFTGTPLEIAGSTLEGTSLLIGLCIVMVGQSLIRQILHYIRVIINANTSQLAVNKMRQDLFDLTQTEDFRHNKSFLFLITYFVQQTSFEPFRPISHYADVRGGSQ